LEYTSIEGETVSLKSFEGKYILFVNVASECGFTSQYEDLETLAEQYKEQLVVIGFPCNQFGGQEPGTSKEIQTFCKTSYVTFDMFSKIDVNFSSAHPLWVFLKSKQGGFMLDAIKWNFTKFIVDKEGNPVARLGPKDSPIPNVEKAIEKLFAVEAKI
jgi:glutathione peroxidase